MRAAVPLLVVAVACALGLLIGCSAQDEVIGRGPTALISENDGSREIEVEVRWTNDEGILRSRAFDLEVNGRVEVRTPDRSEYRVLLEAEADALTDDRTTPTPEPGDLRDPQ